MTVQSLNTIGQSNLDLEDAQPLKMGGSYLGNKMAKIKKNSEVVPLDPEMTQKK